MAGPNSTHPSYDAFIDAWELVRDCIAGTRKIKQKGVKYLPMLHMQSALSYEKYLFRAKFFNVLKRTQQSCVGFVFRNNPTQSVPDSLQAFMDDATMTGKSFYDVEKETVSEVASVGRYGTLVDYNKIEDRAFLLNYATEDIVNWKFGRINGKTMLTLLVLRETSNEPAPGDPPVKPGDDYDHRVTEQFRECRLIQETEGALPYYEVNVWRVKRSTTSKAKQAEWVLVSQAYPTRRSFPLRRIPFIPHSSEENQIEPREVPFEAIAEVNIAHYHKSADYSNALHVAGSPTPVFCGFKFENESDCYLGSERGIISEDPNAKADFLVYDANDASGLKEAMDDDKSEMAALGARILERQGKGGNQEAYQTVVLRQSADISALMSMTIACSQSLSDVLQWVAWWSDASINDPEDLNKKVFTELNTEFIESAMDSPMLQALTQAYMTGAIDQDTYLKRLQRGGVIGTEEDLEKVKEDISKNPNWLPPQPDAPPTKPDAPPTKPGEPPPKKNTKTETTATK